MKGKDFSRRKFLAASGAAAGLATAPAFIRAQTRSSAPIRIGVSLPVSGVFALVGQEAIVGIKMYLESRNYTIAGRKVEVFYEDETVQVNVGVAKARKLLENDRVNALIAGVQTSIIYATAPLVIKERVPYVITVGGGAEITRKSKRNDYSFRTSYNIWAMTYPFAKWIAQNQTKRMFIFCPDYAAGREYAEAFRAGFTAAGGTVTGEMYAPLASPDFVPYLAKVAEAKPDGVFGFWAANAAIRYLQAAAQLGLNKTVKQYLTGFAVDYDTLPAVGDAALGAISVHPWNLDLPNATNQAFAKMYQAQQKKVPSYLPVFGWDAMQAVALAIESVKGDVEDKPKFAAAFKGLSYESTRGPLRIDARTHDIVQDLYVREAVAGSGAGGLPVNKVIATLPNAADPFPDQG